MRSKGSRKNSYFIDTNIFIYAAGGPHRLKQACIDILRVAASSSTEMKTSAEVVQEILHRYSITGQRNYGNVLATKILGVFQPVIPVEHRDILLATELLTHYQKINSRDAVHASVALNRGIKHIISADNHFDTIKEIVRVDPADFA
jgi:predicted nucleic acid-binding protein